MLSSLPAPSLSSIRIWPHANPTTQRDSGYGHGRTIKQPLTAVLAPKAAHGATLSQKERINSIAPADGWFCHDEWAVDCEMMARSTTRM